MGLFSRSREVIWLPSDYTPKVLEKVMSKKWWILISKPSNGPDGYALKGGIDNWQTALTTVTQVNKNENNSLCIHLLGDLGLIAIQEEIGTRALIGKSSVDKGLFIHSFVSWTDKDLERVGYLKGKEYLLKSIKLNEVGRSSKYLATKYITEYGGQLTKEIEACLLIP